MKKLLLSTSSSSSLVTLGGKGPVVESPVKILFPRVGELLYIVYLRPCEHLCTLYAQCAQVFTVHF